MKKRRLIVTLFTFLVAIVVTVSTGFSIFYLNSAQTTDQAPIKVDDIEENYALSDSLNNEDYYDVYFFVDETYAQQNLSVDGMINRAPDTRYHWSNLNSNVTYYQDNGDGTSYGWAKLTVYRSISVEQFDSIGTPNTSVTDTRDYTLMFSGWTANKSAASNCISHRQGNFDYVDAFSSLQVIDSQTTDGSEANDHVVFLYPIWTTGKDYSQTDRTQHQVVVRLFGNGSELYFAQEGSYNDAHYTYRNLTFENDELNDYRLQVSVMGWRQDYWGTSAYSTSWNGSWYGNEQIGASLFNSPGTYNIHAFVFNQVFESRDVQHQSSNEYFNYIKNNELRNCFDSVDGVIVNTLTIQYTGDDMPDINLGVVAQTGLSTFVCYVLIERVYEFKVLGGPFSTFYYEDKSTRHFFDGQIFEDNFNPSIGSDEYSVTYGLNNVFIDTAHEFTDTHVSSEGTKVTGVFRSNVFTIDFWDGLWESKITSFSDDELASINAFNNTDQYQTISADGLLQTAIYQTEGDTSTISDGYDYHLTTNAEALRDMLKITETGLYNFRIQVVYERMTYGSSSEELTNYVRQVKIAIAPVENEYFVKIFQNDNFRYYEHRNENNGIDQYTSTGFVDHFSGNYQDNTLLQHLVFNQQTQFAGIMEKVDGGEFDVDSYLNQLASQNQALFDHVTGEQVTSGFQLDRNHIFYIANI